jgi:hypothetical protein
MKKRSFVASVIASFALAYGSASAAPSAGRHFSGDVTAVSATTIAVTDGGKTTTFLIVPTDGFGVVSADGKTTFQMSAIKVGWPVRVAYHVIAQGRYHADHIVLTK